MTRSYAGAGRGGHLRRRTRLLARHRELNARDPRIELCDIEMMERAIVLARQAAAIGEVPVGAVVYRDGRILAEAANNREASSDPTGHAELVAMRLAGRRLDAWRLQGCSVAVTLEPWDEAMKKSVREGCVCVCGWVGRVGAGVRRQNSEIYRRRLRFVSACSQLT